MDTQLKSLIARANRLGLQDEFRRVEQLLKDSIAVSRLPDLGIGYIPWSSFALRPSTISALLNEVTLNRSNVVIECGIGISTMYLLNPRMGLDVKLVGIDDSADWIEMVRDRLKSMGVPDDRYRLVNAGLVGKSVADGGTGVWYDESAIAPVVEEFLGSDGCSLLSVDGPQGSVGPLARYPALPRLRKFLADDYCVFLDDIGRDDEQAIAAKWCDEFDLEIKSDLKEHVVGLLRPRGTGKTMTVL